MTAKERTPEGLTYAGAGVDVEEEERNIKSLVGALGFARSEGHGVPLDMPGGYAGMVRFGDDALVLCADGVGSKVEIARALGRYDTVGIDCMAMNVNDALCVGAEPLAFVDYLAVDAHDEGFAAQIGAGLAKAAERANVSIIGGETATLPGIVKGFDLAGTCLAWVPQKDILDGSKVRAGDVILGIPSFGLHSNGFSLVRQLVERERLAFTDPFPDDAYSGHTVGEVLLEPTRIYVRAIMALLRSDVPVHGLSHITGGGLMNLPRIKGGVRFVVKDPLRPQPIFSWIQDRGNVAVREMYKTFNMGMGMAVVVPKDTADAALDVLRPVLDAEAPDLVAANAGEGARVVGHVTKGAGCLLEPHGIEFASKT